MRWQTHFFDTVISTNQTAADFPVNSVIVANEQTGGKGRFGRTWYSPTGNLYLSAVVEDYGNATPRLAFVAGVAVAQALQDFDVRLKWPNDVLLQGGKLAGILLERTDDGRTIVGIGINVASCPTTGMIYPTASLNGRLTVPTVLNRVLTELDTLLTVFEAEGFAAIHPLWLRYAAGLGKSVTARLPDTTITGILKEFSPDGALVLETPDGTSHIITAGDILLGNNNDT